jgi:hypothetical protein
LFAAIDDHRARPAHADAAGVSEREIGAGAPLQCEESVQHARLLTQSDTMSLEAGLTVGFSR